MALGTGVDVEGIEMRHLLNLVRSRQGDLGPVVDFCQGARSCRASAGIEKGTLDRRSIGRSEAAQAQGVSSSHRHTRQRHGPGGQDRTPAAGRRTGRGLLRRWGTEHVVGESPEEVLADVGHGGARQREGVGQRSRSSPTRVTPAASMAMSEPAPMATPTSAQASAGASLTPSPTMATLTPLWAAWRARMAAALPSGRTSARTCAGDAHLVGDGEGGDLIVAVSMKTSRPAPRRAAMAA